MVGGLAPRGGLDKPTDRDQQSWIFLNDQKHTLPLTENPKKILSKKQNPKKIALKNTIHFATVKHDVIVSFPKKLKLLLMLLVYCYPTNS